MSLDQEKVDVLYTTAKELGFTGTKESLIENLKLDKKRNSSLKEGKEVVIGGKIFSILSPTPNNREVFSGPEGYEHVRYINGNALTREVQNAGKKLFNSIEEAKAFLTEHVPGKTDDERIQNFAHILGLEKSGCRDPNGGWIHQGKRGCAWLAEPFGGAGYLVFSDDEAGIYWDYQYYSLPVVCFQD